jgi:hypothetical protein
VRSVDSQVFVHSLARVVKLPRLRVGVVLSLLCRLGNHQWLLGTGHALFDLSNYIVNLDADLLE